VPAVAGVMVFFVPLLIHEKERTPWGPGRVINVMEEKDFLMELVHATTVFTYQEGKTSYSVVMTNCEDQPSQWNSMDDLLEGITMCELHTIT